MNQFRDLATVALVALGLGLEFAQPENWNWINLGGPYFVQAVGFLALTRPFSSLICLVLAMTLFMTRLKF